jgi:poly(A) polymerase Pap1
VAGFGSEEEEGEMRMWDPVANDSDRRALMPVLTPAAPCMNSTFNTLKTNMLILKEEFRRADKQWRDLESLCQRAQVEEASNTLVLEIRVVCAEEKKRQVWSALIESKLRVLLVHLENLQVAGGGVLYIRPFPEPVRVGADAQVFEIALACSSTGSKFTVDLNAAVDNFRSTVAVALQARADKDQLVKSCKVYIGLTTTRSQTREAVGVAQ